MVNIIASCIHSSCIVILYKCIRYSHQSQSFYYNLSVNINLHDIISRGYFIYTTCIKTRMYICAFFALSYACIVAWRGNSVGHIMKFFIASVIFRNGGSSIFILLKRTYSSSSFFCTSKNTQSSYIVAPCNTLPPHSSHS